MEFRIQTKELGKSLYMAQGIVDKKAVMPILSNVLINASADGKLSITATDLEVGMICEQAADVSQEGGITVSARHLYDIVRNLPGDKVAVRSMENNWVEVNCENVEYKMMGLSPEEYQGLPDITKAKVFKVDPTELREMIEKTIYAVSSDETRYNLNGAFLEKIGDTGFRMVATDGHRLSMIDAKLAEDPGNSPFGEGVIVPRKGLLEIRRLLESYEGDCLLGVDGNNLVFKMSGVIVVMRLLDGQFPDYRQVVPDNQKVLLKMDRKRLIDSLRRVSILSNDKTLGMLLTLKGGQLKVSTSNPDLGEAKEEMDVEYSGQGLTVGFNWRYLLDVLGAIETEIVDLSLEDDLSPAVFRPAGERAYTCVVMPMRL